MTVLRWAWSAGHWWPAWLGLFTGLFLLRETWALASGRPADTLSDWIWRALRVYSHQPVSEWGAGHLLVFGSWLVLVGWLTFHLFLRWWT